MMIEFLLINCKCHYINLSFMIRLILFPVLSLKNTILNYQKYLKWINWNIFFKSAKEKKNISGSRGGDASSSSSKSE